jgi:hypothetical protein
MTATAPGGSETGTPARLARLARAGGIVALLAGPTVLAFFSGGYFDGPRVWAGLIAWAVVAIALVACRRPFPPGLPGRWAIAGLVLLALWTLVSFTWAPVAGSAYHAGQRVLLYAGTLIAAAALLRDRAAARVVEPALAAGTAVVIGYGLSARLLPGVLHFSRSISAQGRLEQPLTYWNAMGELAALGFVLCARLAGDPTRGRAVRIAAAAAGAPLGLGVYLSVSRGALFACLAGLVCLVVLAPRRAQLQSLALTLAAGVLASVMAAPSGGVTSLSGTLGARERQGAITLVLLTVICAVAALVQGRLAADERADVPVRLPARAPWIAGALVCVGLAAAIAFGSKESSRQPLSSGAGRFETLQSNRYAYWGVALRAFAAEPVRGVGAGGWSVYWLRDRKVNEGAQDAHSLPLQTMAELGVIGLGLLLLFVGGVAWSAWRAVRAAPVLAAGPVAALVTYLTHAPLDWDWQMPAVTLVAVVLAGVVIGAGEPDPIG